MNVAISARDYDKIKKGEKVEIVVKAINRGPMVVECSSKTINKLLARYENAQFNEGY